MVRSRSSCGSSSTCWLSLARVGCPARHRLTGCDQVRLIRKIFLTGVIATSLAAAGCVSYGGFAPGVSTMSEVRSRSGRPTDVRLSSGGEIWGYATSPEGFETYAVVFDGQDMGRSAEQVH